MDPITFGMVFLGASGGTLCLLSAFDKYLNQTAVKLALEFTKFGGVFWLLHYLAKSFMFWL